MVFNVNSDMKSVLLPVSMLAMTIVSSCSSYYYVRTDVSKDLAVERIVYVAAGEGSSVNYPFPLTGRWEVSEIAQPFEVDFRDVTKRMTHSAVIHADKVEKIVMGGSDESNPLLRPVETLDRRFRWFYTYYDYKAVFSGLKEQMPLPYDTYLTDEQLELFFRGAAAPDGWNGVEMYLLLDDISGRFAMWYSDAVYEVMCGIFSPYCTPGQREIMASVKEEFMKRNGRESVFAMKPDEFEDRLDVVAPGNGFGKVYEENSAAVDEAYERESQIISCFETTFVNTVTLPGKYVDGNAQNFLEGNPSWKVDGFRLMYGDMVLEATARKANVWIFILTFVVIAVVLQIFAKIYSVR